jgi:hypothetical protein
MPAKATPITVMDRISQSHTVVVNPAEVAAFVAIVSALLTKITVYFFRRRTVQQIDKLSPEQRLEQYTRMMREKDPVFAVQNPETEELRAIYRQLDDELMLADEVKTPPPPIEVRFAEEQTELDSRVPTFTWPSWIKSRKATGKPKPGTPLTSNPRSATLRGTLPPDPENLMLGTGPLSFDALDRDKKVEYMKRQQERLEREKLKEDLRQAKGGH